MIESQRKSAYPLVSVIMPAYNAEKYIDDAISSVLNQNYPNLELIVIDDASTDATVSRIETIDDSRLHLYCNTVNRGIAYTTNRAISNSRGVFIALMDDDDISLADRLSVEVEYLMMHPMVSIVGASTNTIDAEGRLLSVGREPRNNPKYIRAMLLFQCLDFFNGTAMFRREVFEEGNLLYRDRCYGMQDYLLYIQASKLYSISSINRCLVLHREHSCNTTKIEMGEHRKERTRLYGALRYYSLKKSGFSLSPQERKILTVLLPEEGKGCRSWHDFCLLRGVLCTLLQQAEKMNLDWYEELEIVCKTLLSRAIRSIGDFSKGKINWEN